MPVENSSNTGTVSPVLWSDIDGAVRLKTQILERETDRSVRRASGKRKRGPHEITTKGRAREIGDNYAPRECTSPFSIAEAMDDRFRFAVYLFVNSRTLTSEDVLLARKLR